MKFVSFTENLRPIILCAQLQSVKSHWGLPSRSSEMNGWDISCDAWVEWVSGEISAESWGGALRPREVEERAFTLWTAPCLHMRQAGACECLGMTTGRRRVRLQRDGSPGAQSPFSAGGGTRHLRGSPQRRRGPEWGGGFPKGLIFLDFIFYLTKFKNSHWRNCGGGKGVKRKYKSALISPHRDHHC